MSGVRGPRIESTGRGRFYVWGRTRYWSVTTIIGGGLPKPVLVNWAKKFTAEYAVDHFDALGALVSDDPKGAVDWLKGAAYRDRDKKAELGTIIHDWAEAHVLERPIPPPAFEQEPYMAAFTAWLADYNPTFLAVEAPCFSDKHRYAGTLDCIIEIAAEELPYVEEWGGDAPTDRPWRILGDYKTGKGVYPEVGLQLAAYRYSESFVGLPDGEQEPTPAVDGCATIHLRPEGYEFVPILADERVFEAFLYVREVFRFMEELSKKVVGTPLTPEGLLQSRLEQSLEATS